jgi:hypothetical protein
MAMRFHVFLLGWGGGAGAAPLSGISIFVPGPGRKGGGRPIAGSPRLGRGPLSAARSQPCGKRTAWSLRRGRAPGKGPIVPDGAPGTHPHGGVRPAPVGCVAGRMGRG